QSPGRRARRRRRKSFGRACRTYRNGRVGRPEKQRRPYGGRYYGELTVRLLMLNPNTSTGVTELIDRAARAAAEPNTELTSLTAPRGVPYIATRAEAVIGGAIALEMLAECHQQYDAAVIAAFGDPGLG